MDQGTENSERPRERLTQGGSQSLALAELLALILGTGTSRRPALAIGLALVERFGGIVGIARIALLTSDLEADVQTLKAHGVEFISEPVLLDPPDAPPARFVCFKDPDGTVLELVETEQP